MDTHRLGTPKKLTVIPFYPPFSCFDFVDKHYGKGVETFAIRRLFSLARSHSARTLIVEDIDPQGIIYDENEEISDYVPDHEMQGLQRISFWSSSFQLANSRNCTKDSCVGYAIIKHDRVKSKAYDNWHVFEAVFKKYQHEHNCVPNPMHYRVLLGESEITLEGLLYAQQNGLNKSCAQVALRSIVSRIKRGDIAFRQINTIASSVTDEPYNPSNGLNVKQIRSVFSGFGIDFRDFDYTQYDDNERNIHPYQKFIYSGVESGVGALLGFRLTGPAINNDRVQHIIPFYGHTFNKDTWSPEADIAYFRVGERFWYLPSENWTSSFLGHDDNFGPNFCVPRLYIDRNQVEYVVELLKPGIVFSGVQAEALSLKFLYSVLNQNVSDNPWFERLVQSVRRQMVVLRAIAVDRVSYTKHLTKGQDWDGHTENADIIKVLDELLPEVLWVVEISIPQLFPANERKLGEIVLAGGLRIDESLDNHSHFILARLPGCYYFEKKKQEYLKVPSQLNSHICVMRI